MVYGPDNKPLETAEGYTPDCTACKKFIKESNRPWEGFTPRNKYLFNTFLVAHHFNTLPRIGGIDQQDPNQMEIFIYLKEMFNRQADVDSREFQMKLVGAYGGIR